MLRVDRVIDDADGDNEGGDEARVGPGHCCCRIGPIYFLAGWRKRQPEPGLVWFH